MKQSIFLVAWLLMATSATAALADDVHAVSGLSAAQLFDIASKAQADNDVPNAEALYRALERDPRLDIRCEARFRHGQLLEAQKRYTDAAVLFRAVLDEQPGAQRVRLELAKVLALSGRGNAARRELRQARAGGLPPAVAQAVDQFQAALRSYKPFGGSFELGFAPSSNINRATSATTINTVIAPLELSRDARAESGLGINLSGQVFGQLPVSPKLRLTARLSTQNQLYRVGEFNDDSFAGEIGGDLSLGKSRLRVTGGESARLYGGQSYSHATNMSLNWLRPLGRTAQMEAEGDISSTIYTRNPLQNGISFAGSLSYERAFTQRFGGRITVSGQRQTARDPGYATSSGGGTFLVFHDIGKATVFGSLGINHLESDELLFLFPDRRIEWLYRANLGTTFRYIQVHGFSPVIRLSYERNSSTVGLYDYSRFGGELAITRAF